MKRENLPGAFSLLSMTWWKSVHNVSVDVEKAWTSVRVTIHSTEISCKMWKEGWRNELLWAVRLRVNEKYRRPSTRMSNSFFHRLRWVLTMFCLRRRDIEFCWDLRVTATTQLLKWQQQNFASFFFFSLSWQHFVCSIDPKMTILTMNLLIINNFSFLYRGNACWNLLCWMLTTESSSHLRTGKANFRFCVTV